MSGPYTLAEARAVLRHDMTEAHEEDHLVDAEALRTVLGFLDSLGPQPGDLVERIDSDLDFREVVSVGRDWLTLDLLGKESPQLPKDNYRTVVPAEGVL